MNNPSFMISAIFDRKKEIDELLNKGNEEGNDNTNNKKEKDL